MAHISFIMPAYKAAYLKEAISSILAQTSADWELIVVDDCSPDNLEKIVAEFNDPRIRYYRNETNLGGKDLVAQWNHSITFATGDWIVLAGDDDMYGSRFAEEVIRLAAKYSDVNLIRSRVEQIGEKSEHLYDDGVAPEFETKEEFFEDYLEAKTFTCIGNYAFKKKALLEAGGFFPLPSAFGTDTITPIILSANGVAGTKDMLFKFRQSTIHLSSNPHKIHDKLEAVNKMFEWFESVDYISRYGKRLHYKYMYDIFKLAVLHMPFKALIPAIKECHLCSFKEKAVMFARWIKRHIL